MKLTHGSGWRRIAQTFWRTPDNPQIFGDLEVDARPVQQYLRRLNRRRGVHVTPTAIAVKLVGHVLTVVPELNMVLRRGEFVPRDSIDVFVVVSTGAGSDLSGVRVVAADERSVVEIAEQIRGVAGEVRGGHDPLLGVTKQLLDLIPGWALRPAVGVVDRVVNDVGVGIPGVGLPSEPFGSALVSSIGMFGMSRGYGPLSGVYNVPLFLVVGEIELRPAVEGTRVVVRPTLPFTATIDHRYVDGAEIGRAVAAARAFLADPAAFDAS